jgi:hypothetical protein
VPEQHYKYDVGISFLSADEQLASAIHAKLSEHMKVFVYSKRQEELGGTDGLVSLREAFYSDSRLVVVLYRIGWSETPWTRVEETAIKERFLDQGQDWLLFVTLDDQGKPPAWVPDFRIRFNFHCGLEELLGAIRLRAEQLGTILTVESVVERALRLQCSAPQLDETLCEA